MGFFRDPTQNPRDFKYPVPGDFFPESRNPGISNGNRDQVKIPKHVFQDFPKVSPEMMIKNNCLSEPCKNDQLENLLVSHIQLAKFKSSFLLAGIFDSL